MNTESKGTDSENPDAVVRESESEFRVPDLSLMRETLQAQLKSKSNETRTGVVSGTQSGTQRRAGGNRRGRKKKSTNNIDESILEENDTEANLSQVSNHSQSQSSKRAIKKNRKGETALHLAVMKVIYIYFSIERLTNIT